MCYLLRIFGMIQRFQPLETKKMGGCTSSREFGSQGGSGAFCLKMCDVLAQQDKFSTTLQSILVICKVRNECNLS